MIRLQLQLLNSVFLYSTERQSSKNCSSKFSLRILDEEVVECTAIWQ